jgi:hypothetical protein
MCEKPRLQTAPGAHLVVDPGSARLDLIPIGLQHLVHEVFLVLEIVIELPLAGS